VINPSALKTVAREIVQHDHLAEIARDFAVS